MSKDKPSFLLLYIILTPVILLPVAVILFLFVRGDEAQQLYKKALAAANRGDYQIAAVDFESAGQMGHAESYYSLARLYQSGKLKTANRSEMIYVNLIRASLHGSISATYELGKLSLMPPEADYSQAALYFHSAAIGGHPLAQLELGKLYEKGKGVKKSLLLAQEFYKKSAEQGICEAQTNLALLLVNGIAGKTDIAAAEKFLQQAASRNYPKAFTVLGYIREKQFSQDKNNLDADAQAGIYYRRAAALQDTEALVNYGDWLMQHDRQLEALENYRTAAEKFNFAPALHRMGVYYFKLSTPDYQLSKKYFERAAAKGYAASWRNLGIMAEMGHGSPADPKRAAECYNMADKLAAPAGP